jgi:hypothetical protein
MAYINKLFAVGQASLSHRRLFASACLIVLIHANRQKTNEYKKNFKKSISRLISALISIYTSYREDITC